MRQFFFTWLGHKWVEAKHLYEYCNIKNITTIVEPFAGACGFSLYGILKLHIRNMKYVFNDIDKKLFDFLMDVKRGKLREYVDYHNEHIAKCYTDISHWHNLRKNKNPTLVEWVFMKQAMGQGSMLRSFNKKTIFDECALRKKLINYDDYRELETIFMSDNVELTNLDYADVVKKYMHDPSALIYLDPPYFNSFNSLYNGYQTAKSD